MNFLELELTPNISVQEVLWTIINLVGIIFALISYKYVNNDYEFQKSLYMRTKVLLDKFAIHRFELLGIVAQGQLREETMRIHQHFMGLIIGLLAMVTPTPVRESVQAFSTFFALIFIWLAITWMYASFRNILDRRRIIGYREIVLPEIHEARIYSG